MTTAPALRTTSRGRSRTAVARSSARRSTIRRPPTTRPRSRRRRTPAPTRSRSSASTSPPRSSPRWLSRESTSPASTALTATWATPSPRTSRLASELALPSELALHRVEDSATRGPSSCSAPASRSGTTRLPVRPASPLGSRFRSTRRSAGTGADLTCWHARRRAACDGRRAACGRQPEDLVRDFASVPR